MRITWLFFLGAILIGGRVHADSTEAASPPQIVQDQKRLRSEIEAGTGRYESMPTVKRNAITYKQDKVIALLDGKETLEQLNDEDRVAAFNLLQEINAAVTDKEDERVVCTRERRVGSNMMQRVCKSVAQMRQDREAVSKGMQDMKKACNAEACFGP